MDSIYSVVIVICMCAREVQATLVFNVGCLDCRIGDLTKLQMFWRVYISFAEVGDGDVNKATLLNVHDALSRYKCRMFGYFPNGNYLY